MRELEFESVLMDKPEAGCTGTERAPGEDLLPFDESIGYQLRLTSRLMARYLQEKIVPHGVTSGMWYFLRALWREDGLTQRELSLIVGTMEPTTLTAIKSMEKKGLVRRVTDEADRRKKHIYLTDEGWALRDKLLPLAKDVVDESVEGFSERERAAFLEYLRIIQANLIRRLDDEAAAAVIDAG